MRYIFTCDKCNKTFEDVCITVEQLKDNKSMDLGQLAIKLNLITCKAGCAPYVDLDKQGAPEFMFPADKQRGNLPPTIQIRRKKELAELERLNKEGFRSKSERQEIAHMAREYEKEKGLEKGSISDGVAKTHTKEEVLISGRKKRDAAVKKRNKTLGR